jgi:hypothetical protein
MAISVLSSSHIINDKRDIQITFSKQRFNQQKDRIYCKCLVIKLREHEIYFLQYEEGTPYIYFRIFIQINALYLLICFGWCFLQDFTQNTSRANEVFRTLHPIISTNETHKTKQCNDAIVWTYIASLKKTNQVLIVWMELKKLSSLVRNRISLR